MDRLRALIVGALVALATASGALAHGDPTSHYLETENFLTTYASPPAQAVELQLRGVLDAAAKRGYPIKLSLIANEGDTGGDTPPLEHTQWYAERVAEELESVRPLRAPILIVTPRVIAVAGIQLRDGRLRPIRADDARALVGGVPVARKADGTALARSAMLAVRAVARAGGHPLPASIPPARPELNGSVLARIAAQHDAGGDGWSTLSLIALVLGTAVALGASLYVVARASKRPVGASRLEGKTP